MRRIVLAALLVSAAPAIAQVTATLPVTCNASGAICTMATPVTNPDGSLIGASGGAAATRSTAAGTSDTQAVPVQGVTNGVPVANNVTQIGGAAVTLGQKTQAASIPVSLASDGTYATAARQDTGNTSLNTVAATVSAAGTPAATAQTVQVVSSGTPVATLVRGGASLATGQVSIATTSTLLVAARATRQRVTVSVGAANTCAFGNTGVTTTTGFPLQPVAGATITLDTAAAVYAACSATTTVSYVELVQ